MDAQENIRSSGEQSLRNCEFVCICVSICVCVYVSAGVCVYVCVCVCGSGNMSVSVRASVVCEEPRESKLVIGLFGNSEPGEKNIETCTPKYQDGSKMG